MSTQTKNSIFIDGASVAEEFQTGKKFSVFGLLRCAVYFRQREYKTKIILNRHWRAIAARGAIEDGDQLLKLENGPNSLVTFTPIGSDEKEFLVQLAFDQSGIIVSNNTLDAVKTKRPDWVHFLEHRRLPFRFTNGDFAPLPPTIDGRVIDVDEFLQSKYETESVISSASALADYLLSMKVDDGGSKSVATNGGAIGVYQRFRQNGESTPQNGGYAPQNGGNTFQNRVYTSQAATPQRRYSVGQIIEATADTASIEFYINKKGDSTWTSFERAVYRPHRPVTDLRREFHPGDWVAFISAKSNSGDQRWKVVEVRKKNEMKRGYGRYRPLSQEATSGIIEARYKAEAGGADVFFPGAAIRDEGTLLQNLPRGHWLYYYAFEQKTSAGCSAVAVEVYSATASGIVVKKTDKHIYVWSIKTGIARGDFVRIPEGTWVKFRIQQRSERGKEFWEISGIQPIDAPVGVTIHTEELEGAKDIVLHVRCPAVVGIIAPEAYGAVWTEAFGRLTLSHTCLKHMVSAEPGGLVPYQSAKIWAIYNNELTAEFRREEASVGGGESTPVSTPHLLNHEAVPGRPSQHEGAWRVISVLPSSGGSFNGPEPPFPPPSIIFEVEATVIQSHNDIGGRGPHWICSNEKYGKIFATPMDLAGADKKLIVGDRLRASIIPQPLSFGDEYRAFVMEKIQTSAGASDGE